MLKAFESFLNDESGLEISEYAVGAALIIVALVVVFQSLGGEISNVIGKITAVLNGS